MKTIREVCSPTGFSALLWLAIALGAPTIQAQTTNGASATPASTDDENARAQSMYRQALAVFKSQNFEEARKILLQLWSFRKTYDVASALAKTELKLELYRDAANHLQFCLDNFAPVSSKKTLDTIKEMLTEAVVHVGTLRVKTNLDGAEIQIDGRAVGASPLKSPLYVDPGQHEVTVMLAGDKETEPIEVAAGKDLAVDIPLGHKAAKAPTTPSPAGTSVAPIKTSPPAPTPYVPSEEPKRSVAPLIVGGAVFAAGLGTGIGFLLASNSKQDDAKALAAQNGVYGCYSTASVDCTNQKNAWESKDRDRNISTASFILAGAAAIAVPIYWFWPRNGSSSSSTSEVRLQSAISHQETRVWLSGAF